MRSRTIPFLMVLVLLAGCESPSASKTITAAYEPIEVNANTPLAAVTPKLGDSSWKGTWAANLPEGLIIDTANGAIRGTPTTVSAKADYSVTLTGTGDFVGVDGEATVSITVNEQVVSAAYSQIEAVVNSAVAVSPVLDDSEWEGTWAANLPEGLIIDTASGAISGTPTAVSDKTDYSITLTGTGDFLGVDGEAAVSITILPHAPLNLSAAQLEIIDGTKSDGTMKHASNFMVFDITTSDTVSSAIAVEFLLVKDGDDEPSSLDAFRKTVGVTLIGGTYDLVMTHKSAILPSGATSVYLSHDSAGRYPLKPGTAYKLYEAQPDSDDSSPKSLGSFTTGTYATYTGNLMQHIEDPGTAGNSGRFYTENEQFFVITSLWGQARGPGDGFAIKREGISLTSGGIDIIRNASIFRDFDTFLDQSEKPFPFFHAILGGEQFFEQAGTFVFGDILFVSSGGITFYEVWDPVIAGLSPADGASSSSVTPVLSWDAVSGAGKYRLQGAVSLDTVASAPVEELTQPTYTWPTPLAAGETLYWRVKALDTAGAEGPWGSIASVKIE